MTRLNASTRTKAKRKYNDVEIDDLLPLWSCGRGWALVRWQVPSTKSNRSCVQVWESASPIHLSHILQKWEFCALVTTFLLQVLCRKRNCIGCLIEGGTNLSCIVGVTSLK